MPEQTVLAFDFGKKRIGVAMGDMALKNAHPLTVIVVTQPECTLSSIADLLATWQPTDLVIGLPTYPNGALHPLAPFINAFATKLKRLTCAHIWLVDEQLSSQAASSLLNEAGIFGYKQKPLLDKMAAKVILDTWFIHGGTAFK